MNFKLQNPKTTVGGYLLIIAGLMSAIAKLMMGQMPEISDGAMLIAGLAAIMAKDGGH